jgi:hypothetical protein
MEYQAVLVHHGRQHSSRKVRRIRKKSWHQRAGRWLGRVLLGAPPYYSPPWPQDRPESEADEPAAGRAEGAIKKEANQSGVGRMRRIFCAGLVLALLLPVPAFAAITFTGPGTWTITTDTTNTGFFSIGPASTPSSLSLVYAATNGGEFGTSAGASSLIITSQATITGNTSADFIKETVNSLIRAADIQGGSYTVTTSFTNMNAVNSFTDGAFSSTVDPSLPFSHTTGTITTVGNPIVITIDFEFSAHFHFKNGALSSTTTTISFASGT